MATQRIFSRDIDLKGYTLKNVVFNPMTTAAKEALSLGTGDEGYAVWDTDLNAPYYWDGAAWVTFTGGSGDGFLEITYAQMQALTGGSTTVPYYMTDAGREGFWYYTGTVADQSTDNGGTIIVTADLKQYRRSYTGAIHTSWFGLKLNDSGSGQQTANVAAIAAASAAAASQQWVVTKGGGTLYLNGTTTLANTFNKRLRTHFECDISFTVAGDCFILQGGHGLHFIHIGRLLGPNTVGNNTLESSWIQLDGRGVYMKNLYNAIVKLGEVQFFRTGIEMAGEANTPDTANGSQYNQVWFERSWNNHTQLKITTYGVAGTFGNWCNESFWYNGQIGNGIPGVTYGGGGWWGLVADKSSGASGVSNPQPYYGINGHNFVNVGFEGCDTYIKAGYTGNFTFIGCSFEPDGARTHFDLDPVNTQLWRFLGTTAIRDGKFAPGRKGFKTTIESSGVYGGISNGTDRQYIGTSMMSIPSSPVMTGFDYSADGNFIVTQDTYPGPSALENNDDQTHVIWTKLAQFPTVQNGIIRFGGFRRHGAYKRSFFDSSSNTSPSPCPPVLGYVRVQAGVTVNPKVFQINAKDLVNTSASTVGNFEHFYVEKLNATPIQFVRSDTNAVLIDTDKFPSTGLYLCIWRASGYTTYRIDGGGGTGSISLGPVGTTANANAATLTSGTLNLQPANENFPGLLSTGTQNIAGNKTLIGDLTVRKGTATTVAIDNTSATETTVSALDVTNIVGGAQLRVASNVDFELGRKDTTGSSLVHFANGKTYASGRQWSIGLTPNDSYFHIVNANTSTNALTVFSNGNVTIGTSSVDPGYKLQVVGNIRTTASVYLGNLSSEPSGTNGQIYYNTTLGKLRGFESGSWFDLVNPGGTGGGDITLAGTVGAGATVGASLSSGGVLQMHAATSTAPGILNTGNQTLPTGVKTFSGTVVFRTSTNTAGTAPFKIPPTSTALMLQEEPNAVEHFSGDLYWTNNVMRCKILTACNNAVLTNKTWQGEPIEPTYGGRDIDWEDGTPTYSFGGAQGTHTFFHSCPATNTNARGVINLTTGTGPQPSLPLFTITYSTPANSEGAIVVFSPANANAVNVGDRIWATNAGNTSWTIRVGGTALAASTQYIWNYHVMQLPN